MTLEEWLVISLTTLVIVQVGVLILFVGAVFWPVIKEWRESRRKDQNG